MSQFQCPNCEEGIKSGPGELRQVCNTCRGTGAITLSRDELVGMIVAKQQQVQLTEVFDETA